MVEIAEKALSCKVMRDERNPCTPNMVPKVSSAPKVATYARADFLRVDVLDCMHPMKRMQRLENLESSFNLLR